jgi:hypothetical protein
MTGRQSYSDDMLGFDAWHEKDTSKSFRIYIPRELVQKTCDQVLGFSDISLLVGARSGLKLRDFEDEIDLTEFWKKAAEKLGLPETDPYLDPSSWLVDIA